MLHGILLRPYVVVTIIVWIGILASTYTIRRCNLRQWQMATYYFLTGLVAFLIYAFLSLAATFLAHPPGIGIATTAGKALSLLFMGIGFHKMRRTAVTVGA